MQDREPFERPSPQVRPTYRLWLVLALVVGATLIGSVMLSSLAPAFVDQPATKVYPVPELSREWRGARPDLNLDHMFRQDMPRQRSFQDVFRRPR